MTLNGIDKDHDVESSDVQTTFKYLKWNDLFYKEKPFEILTDIPTDCPDQRKTNLTFEVGHTETVHDVRGADADFSLDTHGFMFVKHPTTLTPEQFRDRKTVELLYLPECERLLRTYVTGRVDQVYFYNWRLRCSDDSDMHGSTINFSDPTCPLGAAMHVHVDQSAATVVERVGIHLPEQADFLLRPGARLQHINIWRPIDGPVKNFPLAVCDGRSMPGRVLVETDRIRRQYAGDTLFAMCQEGYKWYYKSNQMDDEALLFKSFDSDPDVTGYSAHCAFELPNRGTDLPPRKSIELRALVFTYPPPDDIDGVSEIKLQ